MGWGGGRALGLACGSRLVVMEEQLCGRGLCAEAAMLTRGSDGEGRGCRRGAVGVVHSHYAESVSGPNRRACHEEKKLRYVRPGRMTYVPSGSEPATELLPLQLYPRFDRADTKEDMESRLDDSAGGAPATACRDESGSNWAWMGALARLARECSSVDVGASPSSMAEPDQAWPK